MIELKNIIKYYGKGEARIKVLKDINLTIKKGEFVAIMGPSGSGKSTLLNILGALDTPTYGKYLFDNVDITSLDKEKRALFRRYIIGFVFQNFYLLKKTSAIENVMMPLVYMGIDLKRRKKMAIEALKKVGLENKIYSTPSELSGGQQQRVAIARAMVKNPSFLIADEPTGNLDTKRGYEIMDIISHLNKKDKVTVILVTHEEDIAKYAKRVIHLVDGVIKEDKIVF